MMKFRLLASLCLVFFLTAALPAQTIETKKAPDFTLPDISGKNVTLSKMYGQGPVYISFWATWCKPCLEELKIIEKVYERHKDQGFRVFAINTEGPKASAKIKSFVKSYGITFDVLLDNDGEVFRRSFKGSGMPYTMLTNAKGHVLFSGVGFKPGDEVEIEKLIVANLSKSSEPETPAADTEAPIDTTRQLETGK
jgi:cytochrome c biogenesis protein CcmG, thiol:disulfide interchange protein DsbE